MKYFYLFLSFSIFLVCQSAYTQSPLVPDPPRIDARGHILMDYHSGILLAENNADEPLEPASLTKMMTAYVVFHELKNGDLKLNDKVTVSTKAWRTPGSRMFIEVGTQVTVEELIKGMIIQSGNDASVALAEHVAGSEEVFSAMMNEHARSLGMLNTNFTNSTGLPDAGHYTTARDMALLAARLIRDFPKYYGWYSEKEYTYGGITQGNRNLLLYRDNSVDGLKTGHTESAGYCLVSSALRNDMRLVAVVMGAKSESARANESQKLLNYGFRFYETHKLYEAGQAIKDLRIWKGASNSVQLGLADAMYVSVPRGQYKKLDATLNVANNLSAPVTRGQTIGQLVIKLNGETLSEQPLIALEDVAIGGIWRRLTDSVRQLWN